MLSLGKSELTVLAYFTLCVLLILGITYIRIVSDSFLLPRLRYTPQKSQNWKICDQTRWVEGLYLTCHGSCRSASCDIMDARAEMQACVRAAIDAGAGVVLSPMKSIANVSMGCEEAYFDIAHYQKSMNDWCPQLEIRRCGNDNDIWHRVPMIGDDTIHHSGTFGDSVVEVLEGNDLAADANNPILLEYNVTREFWDFQASNETESIQRGIFDALRFEPNLQKIGRSLTKLIKQQYIALRVSSDTNLTTQEAVEEILDQLAKLHKIRSFPSTIYATIDHSEHEALESRLTTIGYKVMTLSTLISGNKPFADEFNKLNAMQKSVVDFIILERGRYFFGQGNDALSALVAFARTSEKAASFRNVVYRNKDNTKVDIRGDVFTKLAIRNTRDLLYDRVA